MDIQQALKQVVEGGSVDAAITDLLERGLASLTTAAQRAASSKAAKAAPKIAMAKGFGKLGGKRLKVKAPSVKIKRGTASLGDWWK